MEGLPESVSHRHGKINVQIIMERLGGGGHQLVAGCQLKDVTVDKAIMQIKEALDEEESN